MAGAGALLRRRRGLAPPPPLLLPLLALVALLPRRGDGASISVLQWNPHWQCFATKAAGVCKAQAERALSDLLVDAGLGLDFANVVELEDDSYQLPASWRALPSVCGRDATALLYNGARWVPSPVNGSQTAGCMVQHDRPYVVQVFESAAQRSFKVLVIGAHFPHLLQYPKGVATLAAAIKQVRDATGASNVLVAADTNINKWDPFGSSADLLRMLGAGGTAEGTKSTDLHRTCCLNDGFHFTFDRVIANFGTDMSTTVLFEPTPEWAVGEFHRAVLGRLALPASGESWEVVHV